MFEFHGLYDSKSGRPVRQFRPYCDFPQHSVAGITCDNLIDTLDAQKEHTHYACTFRALAERVIVSVWRCDCFKEESGEVFYEVSVATKGQLAACKADSHTNFLLMLGSFGITPAARWFPEDDLLDRLERATKKQGGA